MHIDRLYASAPATERGRAVLLGGDLKEGRRVLYCNGRTVVIHDLADAANSAMYVGHKAQTTVARLSPTGYYVASADVQGNVRVWDATQPEQILKSEFRVISGSINDLAWDADSQRLIAVGDGRERFGHAFTFDSGNTVGEISGHCKPINSCHIRPMRPYRAVTCGDDNLVNFFHGPPFRHQLTLRDHTRFVNCVRFSPDGAHFASTGADAKIFLYDGKTGERVSELTAETAAGSDRHTGSIYALAWSPDSAQMLTSSADGTAKIWDVAAGKVVNTFHFDALPNAGHHQVGNIWQGEHLVSLSLSGNLNCLDPRAPEKPARILRGHQRAIVGLEVQDEKTFWSASYDGRIYILFETAEAQFVSGNEAVTSAVNLVRDTAGQVHTASLDGKLYAFSEEKVAFTDKVPEIGATPRQLAISADGRYAAVLTTEGQVVLLADGHTRGQVECVGTLAASAAISPDGKQLSVGYDDRKVRVYALDAQGTPSAEAEATYTNHTSSVTALAYSPDGARLATGGGNGMIRVYDVATHKVALWAYHSARVTSIAWSSDGLYAASGALDTHVCVWSVAPPAQRLVIKNAHQDEVSAVRFLDGHTILSAGRDAAVKRWKVALNA
ncbi:WD40-repeat-containing domain protein [Thamnocephalis sphaerospora]|uniref:WD40-repeat-containing domain protein n=1 Tax=Thamnocephalis sphaerospora TaxID=78915 RepID=A0A4P9XPU1_9FUNG|nr:WD40-repeat-containing domain protein [Thamnocephalis sphaerospora]|eukprot:RKP08018.1 WD40-repeat-containing domain protein [Thamnocephalis sphaerospora]